MEAREPINRVKSFILSYFYLFLVRRIFYMYFYIIGIKSLSMREINLLKGRLMQNKLVMCIILSFVIGTSAVTITQEYSFNTPTAYNGNLYLENCEYYKSSFEPNVPVQIASILLPTGHTIESFSIQYSEPIMLKGIYTVNPYRPNGRSSFEPPPDHFRNLGEAYTKDEFFPPTHRTNERFRVMYKNGHAIFMTTLKPVQFNPLTQQVRYFPKVFLDIKTKINREVPAYKCNSYIRSRLREMVENPEAINNLPDSPHGPDDYEYLIITDNQFENKWDLFIEFNKRRCLRTKVVTTKTIYDSGITGKNDPDKIRNFIKKEYDEFNVVYVMLGGDIEIVPYRGMHVAFYDYGVDYYEDWQVPADLYFSCLDGTWQKPGSEYYGEYGCDEDVGWEVYAARFAVDSDVELANMINKTIKYSETPVESSVENVILSGEKARNKWVWDDVQQKYIKTSEIIYYDDEMNELIGLCTNNGYTSMCWPSNINFSKLYEGAGTWTGDMKAKMINTIRDDKIAYVNHSGHSNTNYILKMATSDVNTSNFQNNGTNANFFLVNTHGCFPGAFDNATPNGSQVADCIGEKFTTISTAAVAFISNTRYGIGPDGREGSTGNSPYTDGSSQRYVRHFLDGISKHLPVEMAMGRGKELQKSWILNSDLHAKPYHGQMKYIAYQYCILGDPALSIWQEKPKTFKPDYAINGTTFTLKTPPHTWVALLDKDKKIVATEFTGDARDSLCSITYDNISDIKFFRVNAHNYLPFEYEGVTNTIKNYAVNYNLKIHANHVGKMFRIYYSLNTEQGPVTISIYNSRGSEIKSFTSNFKSGRIDLPDISCGIYYLQLRHHRLNYTDKFFITR